MKVKGELRNGPRHNFLNVAFWRKFKKESGIEIDYRDFINIIDTSNRSIKKRVLDNLQGFKCPEDLGYWAVSAYKSTKKSIDWAKTNKYGVKVYHLNFHSKGNNARIVWFTHRLSACKHLDEYKFLPDREFQKMKSDRLLEGKIYNSYEYKDFRMKKIRLNLDKLIYGK